MHGNSFHITVNELSSEVKTNYESRTSSFEPKRKRVPRTMEPMPSLMPILSRN